MDGPWGETVNVAPHEPLIKNGFLIYFNKPGYKSSAESLHFMIIFDHFTLFSVLLIFPAWLPGEGRRWLMVVILTIIRR